MPINIHAVNYTQRYKKWKQFTTQVLMGTTCTRLWTIHKDTKNESNSQPTAKNLKSIWSCELYTKIQKMKAIHNESSRFSDLSFAVNYTQRYKKWKQFTTKSNRSSIREALWTIHKDTKNESNSQRTGRF